MLEHTTAILAHVPTLQTLSAVSKTQVFGYFKKYNYEVRERGEVITFVGNYQASRGQAAALVFYVFFGACFHVKPLV